MAPIQPTVGRVLAFEISIQLSTWLQGGTERARGKRRLLAARHLLAR